MKAIQEAVADFLQQKTGVRTVWDRTNVRGEYPLLAVAAAEKGTLLLAGGCQAEHSYEVTVTAASDRQREGNTALLAGLAPLLLRGVPLTLPGGERRVLHPLDIRTEGDRLTFTVEVCVALPEQTFEGEAAAEPMETLYFGL